MPLTYRLVFGNEPPAFVTGIDKAQSWLDMTIRDLHRQGALPAWRANALIAQVENMPNAGLTFLVHGIGIVKAEKT